MTSNNTNREPTAILLNISFIYKTFLQTFQKSICLVKEFFLLRSFWRNITTVTSQNIIHFRFFFHYTVNFLLLLSYLYLNKPL